MKDLPVFWEASLEDLKRGYLQEQDYFQCLLCGTTFEQGVIYSEDGRLYEAEKYTRVHIEKTHQSVFHYLTSLDKKLTGLTEHQSSLLQLFYQGKTDAEVQQELGIGSSSTIRNHRFVLKEKERQAKLFLAMMELLKEKDKHAPQFVPVHKTATMIDERYNVTAEEKEKILNKYFPAGTNGPLTTFDMKEKYKLVVLREITSRFTPGENYSEREVNEILEGVYHDYVTLRRYLIEYGFMDREDDGSKYWVKENNKTKEKERGGMDRRKELVAQYMEQKTIGGVYQIRNKVNGKLFVDSASNLKQLNGKELSISTGTHSNKQLVHEWKEFGKDSFVIEVLEEIEMKKDDYGKSKEQLKKLEEKWLEELKPYGERGYHGPLK